MLKPSFRGFNMRLRARERSGIWDGKLSGLSAPKVQN